jgi:hypothetical protein
MLDRRQQETDTAGDRQQKEEIGLFDTHTHTHTNIHTCTYKYTNTYTHIHTYIYIYITHRHTPDIRHFCVRVQRTTTDSRQQTVKSKEQRADRKSR